MMKRKKVRTSFYADEETVRQLDWLARELKASRSEVVERAIRLFTGHDNAAHEKPKSIRKA